jgi:hypothetical protein
MPTDPNDVLTSAPAPDGRLVMADGYGYTIFEDGVVIRVTVNSYSSDPETNQQAAHLWLKTGEPNEDPMPRTTNRYRSGPYVTTSGGRPVWSFNAFLEECYEECGERSTKVLDAANLEWNGGKKNVPSVCKKVKA